MIPQFPFHRQLGEFDCGVSCLKMITDYFGKSISFETLQHFLPVHEEGVSLKDMSDLANSIGLKTMGVKVNYERLVEDIPTPCIAFWRQQHFVVIYHVSDEYIWIADPASRGIYVQSKEIFKEGWICDENLESGILLLFEKTPSFSESKISKNLELSI